MPALPESHIILPEDFASTRQILESKLSDPMSPHLVIVRDAVREGVGLSNGHNRQGPIPYRFGEILTDATVVTSIIGFSGVLSKDRVEQYGDEHIRDELSWEPIAERLTQRRPKFPELLFLYAHLRSSRAPVTVEIAPQVEGTDEAEDTYFKARVYPGELAIASGPHNLHVSQKRSPHFILATVFNTRPRKTQRTT